MLPENTHWLCIYKAVYEIQTTVETPFSRCQKNSALRYFHQTTGRLLKIWLQCYCRDDLALTTFCKPLRDSPRRAFVQWEGLYYSGGSGDRWGCNVRALHDVRDVTKRHIFFVFLTQARFANVWYGCKMQLGYYCSHHCKHAFDENSVSTGENSRPVKKS